MKDTILYSSGKCYLCDLVFDDKNKKTAHHCIPQFLKPKRNVVVPLCIECHKEVNKHFVGCIPKPRPLPKAATMINQIEGTKGAIMRGIKKLDVLINNLGGTPKEPKESKDDNSIT